MNTFNSRVYNIKDSFNSLKILQLVLTDENGELIEFIEPFTLNIAVFFKSVQQL